MASMGHQGPILTTSPLRGYRDGFVTDAEATPTERKHMVLGGGAEAGSKTTGESPTRRLPRNAFASAEHKGKVISSRVQREGQGEVGSSMVGIATNEVQALVGNGYVFGALRLLGIAVLVLANKRQRRQDGRGEAVYDVTSTLFVPFQLQGMGFLPVCRDFRNAEKDD